VTHAARATARTAYGDLMKLLLGWSLVLLVAACGDDGPVNTLPDAPADAPPDAPRACITPTGAGTVHTAFNTAETWTEAASPHIINNDTTVSAAITIEACAIVKISGGKTVTINTTGSITANGLAGLPVTIERLDAGTAYGPIRAIGGVLSLTHTNLTGGGNPLGPVALGGVVIMQRSLAATTGSLHMDHVSITGSASNGVVMSGAAGFDAASTDLIISGAAGNPFLTSPNLAGSIPTGTFTGNAINEVMIDDSGGQVTTSQTYHDRGIPYRVGDAANATLDVVAPTGSPAVLTLEPGVVMKFHPGGTLRIDTNGGVTAPAKGALIAIGTLAKPIVFTSIAATPAAGDWLGISFAGLMNPASRIQYARVEYAGGVQAGGSNSCPYPGRVGQNDAAIRIFGTPAPLTQFITDTTILASARDGIDRGWRDDPQPDFLPTNTFTNVVACKQTVPRTTAGVCPATPACP
jgi:hypothetical protein